MYMDEKNFLIKNILQCNYCLYSPEKLKNMGVKELQVVRNSLLMVIKNKLQENRKEKKCTASR